eukprot:gene18368-12996_t
MSWKEGDVAKVVGLQGRAELNGRFAVVAKGKWPNSKKRIGVRVQGDTTGKPLSLKANNMDRVEGEDAKAAARMLLDGTAGKHKAGELKTDAEIAKDVVECVGTFRWREDKRLPSLPTVTSTSTHTRAGGAPPSKEGWGPWLQWRCPENPQGAVQLAQSDPCLLDGLSFPLSLCFALDKLGMSPAAFKLASDGGAAGAAEFTSRYAFADLHIIMVGPECDAHFLDDKKGRKKRKARLGPNTTVEAVTGVLRPLLEARPELAQWQYANDATRSDR